MPGAANTPPPCCESTGTRKPAIVGSSSTALCRAMIVAKSRLKPVVWLLARLLANTLGGNPPPACLQLRDIGHITSVALRYWARNKIQIPQVGIASRHVPVVFTCAPPLTSLMSPSAWLRSIDSRCSARPFQTGRRICEAMRSRSRSAVPGARLSEGSIRDSTGSSQVQGSINHRAPSQKQRLCQNGVHAPEPCKHRRFRSRRRGRNAPAPQSSTDGTQDVRGSDLVKGLRRYGVTGLRSYGGWGRMEEINMSRGRRRAVCRI